MWASYVLGTLIGSLKDLEKYKAMVLVMKILLVYEQRQTCKNMFTLQYGRC